jgi:hypothetical protein
MVMERAGIPARVAHLFAPAGVAAMEAQRREYDAHHARPGAFARYCEMLVDAFLAARQLALAPGAS